VVSECVFDFEGVYLPAEGADYWSMLVSQLPSPYSGCKEVVMGSVTDHLGLRGRGWILRHLH
jgi:hypothetical protein